jgi:hypothetical protein
MCIHCLGHFTPLPPIPSLSRDWYYSSPDPSPNSYPLKSVTNPCGLWPSFPIIPSYLGFFSVRCEAEGGAIDGEGNKPTFELPVG